jgi:hypothetical protein
LGPSGIRTLFTFDAKCDLKVDDMREVFQDGELLTTCLEIGDYFAIIDNDDIKTSSVGFWILMFTKRLHVVTLERHVDAYG